MSVGLVRGTPDYNVTLFSWSMREKTRLSCALHTIISVVSHTSNTTRSPQFRCLDTDIVKMHDESSTIPLCSFHKVLRNIVTFSAAHSPLWTHCTRVGCPREHKFQISERVAIYLSMQSVRARRSQWCSARVSRTFGRSLGSATATAIASTVSECFSAVVHVKTDHAES